MGIAPRGLRFPCPNRPTFPLEQELGRINMARRLRQVTDLYVTGEVAVLADGSPVWVQALNPFEQDTARNEAQIARARLTMAIKEFGSDEQAKVRYFFFEDGLEEAREKIVDAKVAEVLPRTLERMRNDPDWEEKLNILERGLDGTASLPEPEEIALLEKLAGEYQTEVGTRLHEERTFQQMRYADATEESLWADYLEWYLARRASEIMLAEYQLHQILFGARECLATQVDDKHWSHENCGAHAERLFLDKEEVRQAPETLLAVLLAAAESVEMTVREAKNSVRQGSSSDSSPLPSEAEASTASTPSETRVELPGTSSSLSAMR